MTYPCSSSKHILLLVYFFCLATPLLTADPLLTPASDLYTEEQALKMQHHADTTLAPVYGPLAEYLVERFQLADKKGIGIDLGSGPGNLIIELCQRTEQMFWINADINPHFFPMFLKAAAEAGVRDRVSAVFADAQALPFRDDYADIIVSRGSFQFWEDKQAAFAEIHRVLKPGGIAYVGRGLSENLPVAVAREVRAKQNGGPRYDVPKTAAELEQIMQTLGIRDYQIHLPNPRGSEGVNYGVWLEFHKRGETHVEHKEDVYQLPPIDIEGRQIRDVVADPLAESTGLAPSTTVVSEEEITRQGAESVIESIEYVPGAWVETRGRKVKQFLSVRGQKYPFPDYAVDGSWQREFHELPYFFAPTDLERIEVLRSSAALLKGISGMAGVVNLIPKDYTEPATSAIMEYGTFDSYRFHLSHGATVKQISYAIGGGSRHTDGPEARQAAENISNFRGSLTWTPDDSLTVQTHLFHLYGKRELARAEPPAATRFQKGAETFDPIQATLASVKAHYQPDARMATELLLSYADRDHTFISRGEASHTSTREHDYEWTANVIQALSLLDQNKLRVGLLYNHWVAPNGKRFYVGRRTDLETISAVAVDEHRFGSLLVDAGLRWSKTHINEYGAFNINGSGGKFRDVMPIEDVWEPALLNGSAGLTYRLSRRLSLHGNIVAGVVQPRSGSLDINHDVPANESRLKVDLGARLRVPRLGQLSLVGFLVQQKDAIVLSGKTEEVEGRILELYLNRDQDQVGVEIEVRTVPLFEAVQGFVNATLMRSRADSQEGMVEDEEKPEFVLNVGIYATKSRFNLNLFAKYVSAYTSTRFAAGKPPEPQPLGDFLELNATASCALDAQQRTQIYLEARNLTDRRFSTVVGYPDFGRRFTVGLRHTF